MSTNRPNKPRTILLDNAAIGALLNPAHPQHRRLMAIAEAQRHERSRKRNVSLGVPLAIRVEAKWDRTKPDAAAVNRLPLHDFPLTAKSTNVAARLREQLGVGLSVPDAHLGATLHETEGPHLIYTSDEPYVEAMVGNLGLTNVTTRLI